MCRKVRVECMSVKKGLELVPQALCPGPAGVKPLKELVSGMVNVCNDIVDAFLSQTAATTAEVEKLERQRSEDGGSLHLLLVTTQTRPLPALPESLVPSMRNTQKVSRTAWSGDTDHVTGLQVPLEELLWPELVQPGVQGLSATDCVHLHFTKALHGTRP